MRKAAFRAAAKRAIEQIGTNCFVHSAVNEDEYIDMSFFPY